MMSQHCVVKLTDINSHTSQLSVTQNYVTPVTFMAQTISVER